MGKKRKREREEGRERVTLHSRADCSMTACAAANLARGMRKGLRGGERRIEVLEERTLM